MAKGVSTYQACPKFNLFIKVTGKRADGYHLLRSLFVPLDSPCDTITVGDGREGVKLLCDAPGVPAGMDNIVCRAALAFAAESGIAPAWEITLRKRIPVAAGMGGGSADAAAVLRALNARCGRPLADADLARVALGLGADVPFFLHPGVAVAEGVGERLTPVEGLKFPPMLGVYPEFGVSAKWAYQHLEPARIGDDGGGLERLIAALRAGDFAAAAESVHNDLGFALFKKFPLLAMIREFLSGEGALTVEVTGSGSTLFALFPDRDVLQAAGSAAANRFPGLRWFEATVAEDLR